MSLTDRELIELERLLNEQQIFNNFDKLKTLKGVNPNYKFLHDSITQQSYNDKDEINGGYRGAALEGSSRSGKTWSGVDICIFLAEYQPNCTINIVRETYAEHKETTYLDFKRRLDDYGLDNPFHRAKEVKTFDIKGAKITFLGCDKLGKKHGAGSDYTFFNEVMHIPRDTFDQLEMRNRVFWWADYNPSLTQHWFFENVLPRADVGFLRTTFLDNPFISSQEKNKILSYEPYKKDSYQVIENEIIYNGQPVNDTNQPPLNIENVDQGTADQFNWKVYGLGLRGSMKGLIFNNVRYIDKFPDLAYSYGLDFGFTNDPTAMVRYAEEEDNIYLELLCYQPIETPQEINALFEALGIERNLPITADSSDKYTGENKGTVEMVVSLNQLGWSITKVSKTKSIIHWLLSMKQKKIHIIKNNLYKYAKAEQENYRFKSINGIEINQPIDKFNHFFDAARYAHMNNGLDFWVG